jgi:hypothetical protein
LIRNRWLSGTARWSLPQRRIKEESANSVYHQGRAVPRPGATKA